MARFEVVEPATNRPKTGLARALRKAPTAGEASMWRLLRGKRLAGLKFRRQAPLGRYIVDFLCLRHRLILEIDGPLHDAVYDAERDAWLVGQGFKVIRVPSLAVSNDPNIALDAILAALPPHAR